jgi:hypothetical protein
MFDYLEAQILVRRFLTILKIKAKNEYANIYLFIFFA